MVYRFHIKEYIFSATFSNSYILKLIYSNSMYFTSLLLFRHLLQNNIKKKSLDIHHLPCVQTLNHAHSILLIQSSSYLYLFKPFDFKIDNDTSLENEFHLISYTFDIVFFSFHISIISLFSFNTATFGDLPFHLHLIVHMS